MLHLYYRLRHHLLARGKLPGAATSVRVRIHENGEKTFRAARCVKTRLHVSRKLIRNRNRRHGMTLVVSMKLKKTNGLQPLRPSHHQARTPPPAPNKSSIRTGNSLTRTPVA